MSAVETNSIPWCPVLRYATPLSMIRTPVSTVGGLFRPFCGTPHPSRSTGPRFDRRRSVSSVLWYATPLPINRTPVSTVGGPFSPFCGTPQPPRSTGPRFERRRSVSFVLRYATPLPMNRIPLFDLALQHKSVSSILRYATPLPINRTLVSTVGGPFRSFCGTPHPSRSTGPPFRP